MTRTSGVISCNTLVCSFGSIAEGAKSREISSLIVFCIAITGIVSIDLVLGTRLVDLRVSFLSYSHPIYNPQISQQESRLCTSARVPERFGSCCGVSQVYSSHARSRPWEILEPLSLPIPCKAVRHSHSLGRRNICMCDDSACAYLANTRCIWPA